MSNFHKDLQFLMLLPHFRETGTEAKVKYKAYIYRKIRIEFLIHSLINY